MRALALVLVIHGGSFVAGSPADTASTTQILRDRGIPAMSVSYRLGNPQRAENDVVRVARRLQHSPHLRLYAIGYSAGGTIAEVLAERRLVELATAVAPWSDLRYTGDPQWCAPGSGSADRRRPPSMSGPIPLRF